MNGSAPMKCPLGLILLMPDPHRLSPQSDLMLKPAGTVACGQLSGSAQSMHFSLRVAGDTAHGTAGAICLNDAGQAFVLTCGHVLLDQHGKMAERVELLRLGKVIPSQTRLWRCLPQEAGEKTRVDAALVQITSAEAEAICRNNPSILPKGIRSGPFDPDEALSLLTHNGINQGSYVTAAVPIQLQLFHGGSYVLLGAHGYSLPSGSQGGDSGAPVRDAQDRLVGLHCGAVDVFGLGYNAVFCDIGAICLALGIRVVEHGSRIVSATHTGVSPAPASTPPASAGISPNPNDEITTVALTIWAEAGLRGKQAMEDVAAVIYNRWVLYGWFGKSLSAVCRNGNQFPCWNPAKTSGPRMVVPTKEAGHSDDQIRLYDYAKELSAKIRDNQCPGVHGKNEPTHYHPDWLRPVPHWALSRQPEFVSGGLIFYSIKP